MLLHILRLMIGEKYFKGFFCVDSFQCARQMDSLEFLWMLNLGYPLARNASGFDISERAVLVGYEWTCAGFGHLGIWDGTVEP